MSFSDSVCNPGVKDPTGLTTWLKSPGKYYNKCPCPNTGQGYMGCPTGYDLSAKFPNYSEKQLNPIHNSIAQSGYSNKSCAVLSGTYPYPVAPDKWDPTMFKSCLNFYNLQKGVNVEEKKLKPVNTIYSNMRDAEHFNADYNSLYDIDINSKRSSELTHRKGSKAHLISFSYDASKANLALPARASDVDEAKASSTHRGGSEASSSYDINSERSSELTHTMGFSPSYDPCIIRLILS